MSTEQREAGSPEQPQQRDERSREEPGGDTEGWQCDG
jgi:hypothetical protein